MIQQQLPPQPLLMHIVFTSIPFLSAPSYAGGGNGVHKKIGRKAVSIPLYAQVRETVSLLSSPRMRRKEDFYG